MRVTWKKFLILAVALSLASSLLYSADLHWLFWDKKEAPQESTSQKTAQETLVMESEISETENTEKALTKPEEPLKNSGEESLENEPTGFEDYSDEEVIAAAIEAIEDMDFATEVKDEGYVVVSAQYEAKVADYENLRNEYNKLAKKVDPLKVFVLPEITYTFGENPWGAGLTFGMAYNNFMVSMGVDKQIQSWESLANPDGYTMRMGLGFIF